MYVGKALFAQVMVFAQFTYRESLRDIAVCLSAQARKLYHMGIRSAVASSTLADANETRDWRICAQFAQALIAQARRLYAGDSFGGSWRTPSMHWTPPPSACACRCSPGRRFARPGRR